MVDSTGKVLFRKIRGQAKEASDPLAFDPAKLWARIIERAPGPVKGIAGIKLPAKVTDFTWSNDGCYKGQVAATLQSVRDIATMSTILSNDAFNFSGGVPCALFVNKMPARPQLSAGPRGGLKTFAKLAERAGLDAANFDERPGAHDEPRALPPPAGFQGAQGSI